MRKTLTVLTLIAVAGSLAACKMPWDSEPKPAEGYAKAPVETASPTPTPADPSTTAMSTTPATTSEPSKAPTTTPATK